MRIGMEFEDQTAGFYKELGKKSLGLVKQGISQVASKIAAQYKIEIKKHDPSDWGRANINGKGYITLNDRKKQFGDKHSRRTGDLKVSQGSWHGNIADHVTFFAPPGLNDLNAVVGGKHKHFYPRKWVDGVDVGQMSKQSGTSSATVAILTGLEEGGKRELKKWEREEMARAKKKLKDGSYVNLNLKDIPTEIVRKPRKFAEAARGNSIAGAVETIRKLHDTNIVRVSNNIKEKPVRIVV